MFIRRQYNRTHGPITRRIVVDLGFLAALLLLHLVLAQIELDVSASGGRIPTQEPA